MPETCFPIRTKLQVPISSPALALLWISVTLGGCSGGDFGRTRQDVLNDDMHRWIGTEATSSIGLRPSQFQLTDNERLLRDLAYPLIEPPHSRPAWKSVFGNYQPLPAPWRQQVVFDRTAYGRLLIDEPHRSHSSRYAQLMDDVRDDITRFEPFFADAVRVLELDKKRNASLALVSGLSPREHADAIARMQEPAHRRWSSGAAAPPTKLENARGRASQSRQHHQRPRPLLLLESALLTPQIPVDRRTCRANREPAGRRAAGHRTCAERARLKISVKLIPARSTLGWRRFRLLRRWFGLHLAARCGERDLGMRHQAGLWR